eukprot:3936586-Rhodomonas_salina.2
MFCLDSSYVKPNVASAEIKQGAEKLPEGCTSETLITFCRPRSSKGTTIVDDVRPNPASISSSWSDEFVEVLDAVREKEWSDMESRGKMFLRFQLLPTGPHCETVRFLRKEIFLLEETLRQRS